MTAPRRATGRGRKPAGGSRGLASLLAGARSALTTSPQPSAAPPHSSGLAAARLVGRASRGAVQGLVALRGLVGDAEHRLGGSLRGPMVGVAGAARTAIHVAERVVTPGRAVGATVLAAAIALGASQFVDYRGVEIGSGLYEGVESIAPAPQTDRDPTGSAHGYALLGVAVLAVAALGFAARGRWQAGRAVALLGAVGVAVSLIVDLPKGLDEGMAALGFEGAEAHLIEGFWVQLSASVVLLVCGLLLAAYGRATRAAGARA